MTTPHPLAPQPHTPYPRPSRIAPAEWDARVQLAAAYRIFDHLGWTELIYNHISLRVPDEAGCYLINPFGLHYREVTASTLVLIDLEGNVLRESKWSVNRAGLVIHSASHGASSLPQIVFTVGQPTYSSRRRWCAAQ